MNVMIKTTLAAAIAAGASLASAQSLSIDTTVGWKDPAINTCTGATTCLYGFGSGVNAVNTVGETISTSGYTTNTLLKSFTFYISNITSAMKVLVYSWVQDPNDPASNPSYIAGPALASVDLPSVSGLAVNSPLKAVTANFGGGVLLNPNSQYVILISTAFSGSTVNQANVEIGQTTTNAYNVTDSNGTTIGGEVVYQLGSSSAFQMSDPTVGFDCGAGSGCASNGVGDLAFKAVIAVPEPGTYALLAAGLGVVGFVGRRRGAAKA